MVSLGVDGVCGMVDIHSNADGTERPILSLVGSYWFNTDYAIRNTSRAALVARYFYWYLRAVARGACYENNVSSGLQRAFLSQISARVQSQSDENGR